MQESDKQDLQAYTDLIKNVLVPAELFVTWHHEETAKKVVRFIFSSLFDVHFYAL